MTDEEVLRIAQGLSSSEWYTLDFNERFPLRAHFMIQDDGPLAAKGLVKKFDDSESIKAVLTPLGKRVLDWRHLFDAEAP